MQWDVIQRTITLREILGKGARKKPLPKRRDR